MTFPSADKDRHWSLLRSISQLPRSRRWRRPDTDRHSKIFVNTNRRHHWRSRQNNFSFQLIFVFVHMDSECWWDSRHCWFQIFIRHAELWNTPKCGDVFFPSGGSIIVLVCSWFHHPWTRTLTCCLVVLVLSLLVEVQCEQEVGVPGGFLVTRHLVAPRCQSRVQEKRCLLGAGGLKLRLVLQLCDITPSC